MPTELFQIEIEISLDKFCYWLDYLHIRSPSTNQLLYFHQSPLGAENTKKYFYGAIPFTKIKVGRDHEDSYMFSPDATLLGTLDLTFSGDNKLGVVGWCKKDEYRAYWMTFWGELHKYFFPDIDEFEMDSSNTLLSPHGKISSSYDHPPKDVIIADLEKYTWIDDINRAKVFLKSYNPITAKAILKAIPIAFRDLDSAEHKRWGSGIIARSALFNPTTVGRYLDVFRKLGIERIDGINLPPKTSHNNQKNRSIQNQ